MHRVHVRALRPAGWLLVKEKDPAKKLGLIVCSPDWTRTSNPSINSRMLCQLSYGGMFMVMFSSPQRVITLLELFQPRKSKFRKLGHTSRGLVEVSLALAFFCVAAFLIPVVVVGCAGILQVRWRR